ncbi:MAG: triose-phosphate isomerase [Thaumarchaeota archaeon]|nr:triose-phosphate isomerase [Candidatus Calditenuaceae archaeon]MDW8186999.1 triose-phosphate isomerase [Nitrososphaerota archaeon]
MKRWSYPVVVLNFKAYREAVGSGAERLAYVAETVSKELGVTVAVAVQPTDVHRLSSRFELPILGQHVDPHEEGSWTGHVTAVALREAGAEGSLLNHSERRIGLSEIAIAVELLRKEGLRSIVCADTPLTSKAAGALRPDLVAVEPPELIGTGISVSKARPEVVTEAVRMVSSVDPGVPVLCGAGISTPEDVYRAIELGTVGVLISSAFVKSKDPQHTLTGFCQAALKSHESRSSRL